MTHWLLTAEADKIQHLVFRSSHLREVVGGSQLLTRFCTEFTPMLLQGDPYRGRVEDIIVADGGSFTIDFQGDTPELARAFGQELAQRYRAVTGSTMTVAPAEAWSGQPADFAPANKRAREALTVAKRQGRPAEATDHWPFTAFCASCGIGLAHTHEPLHERERANYLCPSCRLKRDERSNEGTEFLATFMKAVAGTTARRFDWPKEAEDLADWDPRGYVAYLVADGNGMGATFRRCSDRVKMREFSMSLTNVLRTSLASPVKTLMTQAPGNKEWLIPALPLILGGDDVFMLLPAPYALDFARRFCQAYETLMTPVLQDAIGDDAAKATMSAAVVICKSKYPHTLVHAYGERLLKEAKRLAKAAAQAHPDHAHSIINFDLIVGHRIAGAGRATGQAYRPTLRPYWVTTGTLPPQVGLPVDRLLEARLALKDLPKRRLAQLRQLFEPGQLPNDRENDLGQWQAQLGHTIGRVAHSDKLGRQLRKVETTLGGNSQGNWYNVQRPGPRADFNYGHGLPDLIQMWDFCYDLEHDRRDYEAEE